MNYPSQEWIGAVASFYYAGQALGCLLQVLVADRIGRIPFLQLLTAFAAIGPVIQTVSTNMQTFIAGRALAGLPTGAMYTTIALYLCEIAPAHNRGLIAGCSGLMLGLGIMISNWVGMACSYAPYGSLQWRLPIALQTPWSCILLIGLATFVPESPRYLIFQGRIAHARAVFDRLRIGYNLDEADHEFAQMTAQIDFEARRRLASSERIRLFRYRMAVALICGIIPSLTGAQVIGYYQVRLYQTLGIEVRDRLTLAGAHGTVSFLAVLFTDKLVIDRWGRRNLLLLGLAGSVFCQIYCAITQWQFAFGENIVGKAFAVLGIYLFTVVYCENSPEKEPPPFPRIMIIALYPQAHQADYRSSFFFVFPTDACFGSTPGIYQAEVLPIAVRSKVTGVTGAASLAIIAGFSEAAPMAFVTIKHNCT